MLFELWTFYLSENPEKIIIWFSQKFEAAQLFPTLVIIRNVLWAANQHTLLEWFLKDHVTLNTKVMMLKIQLCITGINCILKCKMVILNCNNISKYYCFYCIFVKKMVIGEHKRLLSTKKMNRPQTFIHPRADHSLFLTLSCVTYFEHAETGRLHVSGSVYITLHEIHSIFRQSCQQDAFQITRLLHLIGQLVYVTRQLKGGEKTVYYIVNNETWTNSGVSGSYLSVV